MARSAYKNLFSPLSHTLSSRAVAASCEVFERVTRTYPKPAFNLPAAERVVWERPFCRLIALGEPSTKPNLPASRKTYHLQVGSGHDGISNGAHFRSEIAPEMVAFMGAQSELAKRGSRWNAA